MTELIIKYASGPVIGAIIGYFTNYIAVKMLFRPHRQKKLFGLILPFTPGIIPKRRGDLAKAVGNAISKNLLTTSDIEKNILSEENKKKLTDLILSNTGSEKSPRDIIADFCSGSESDALLDKTAAFIADKLVDIAEKINAGRILTDAGRETIEEKKQSLGMFSFLINDMMLDPLLEEFENKINVYISANGKEKLLPVIREQLDSYSKKPLNELTSGMDKERAAEILSDIIEKTVSTVSEKILADMDIAKTVEDKINAMDIAELEALCLSVMKKELNAIVNLGALIGLIIGVINSFI